MIFAEDLIKTIKKNNTILAEEAIDRYIEYRYIEPKYFLSIQL